MKHYVSFGSDWRKKPQWIILVLTLGGLLVNNYHSNISPSAINHLPYEGNLWYVNNLMLHLHANWNVLIFHLKKNKQMKKFKPIFIMQIWAI